VITSPIPLAHALVGREDLPIPAWLFAWGASLVLIVSFIALSAAWRTAQFEEDRWRPLDGRISRLLTHRAAQILAGAIGVFLLWLAIWSGLRGTEAADRNFSLTFIFVTVWLGFPLASVLLGDVFRAFNPWRALGRVAGFAFKLVAGQEPRHLRYPERLGRWPAVVGLLAFVWLELVYGASDVSIGLSPHTCAVAALAYSAYTVVAMALFGTETWMRRGEALSVYFNMFSQLAPLEARDGRLGIRRPLAAATGWATVPGSVALVATSIGTTSFDGAQEGALQDAIASTFERLVDAGMSLVGALRTTDSLYMALCVVGVAVVFLLGVQGMRTVHGSPGAARLRTAFAHTLIPIAFAYLVAHYFSLFVFQEQAQFTYLLSDPLGHGADIFGTASSGIDYGVIGARTVWYVQVAALVVGHVCGLTLAHDRAIAVYGDYEDASRSQYWMLAVMVAFTCFGLYLLSQANQ
jgi:hypothetical protein